MISLNYYAYKKHNLNCKECNWSGLGKEANQGEIFDELFELDCPNCSKTIAYVGYPTHDEVLKHGDEEDKAKVKEEINFHKRAKLYEKKTADGLPEFEAPIFIEIKETLGDANNWLELYANDIFLWKEVLYYEYQDRLVHILNMLDEKYSGRIEKVKFEKSFYLLGDDFSSPHKVEETILKIKARFNKK
jgi:hypothetical protein